MDKFNPFTFQGRIGRLQYFGFGVVWALILGVASLLLFSGADSSVEPGVGGALAWLLFMLAYAIGTISYGVRRLHDFDKSGWWYLLFFVPFASFIMSLVLLLAPGTPGPNSYGVR